MPIVKANTDSAGGVRQVTAVLLASEENRADLVAFKRLVGLGRRSAASGSMADFVKWARHEVVRNENSWERIHVE